MLREGLKNITIDNLKDSNKISVRTSNCCHNAKFKSLLDIIEYYEKGNSFLDIRNVGRRTSLELEALCKEYILKLDNSAQFVDEISEEEKQNDKEGCIKNLIENDFLNSIEAQQINSIDILNYLSANKKVILEDKFKQYIAFYSIRTANRIREIGFENFVTNYLFSPNNELFNIRGIGRKSIIEVIDLKDKMTEEFLLSVHLQEEDIVKLNLIREKGEVINDFVFEFYNKNNHLPMFWILEQKINSNKNRDIEILIDSFPIFQNNRILTLEDIASKHNLTRERIRQIKNSIFYQLFKITDEINECKNNDDLMSIIELLQNKKDWEYITNLIKETHLISKASNVLQNQLKLEQSTFSVDFVLQIIAYVFRDRFSLLGGFVLNSNDKFWETTYLIKKNLVDIFNFEQFKKDFSNELINNTSDYLLDVDNFIDNSLCWKIFEFDKSDKISSITKDILVYEFGLYPEDIESDLIKIPASKSPSPLDVVYDILKMQGKPMHLDEVFIEFKKILPEHKYTIEDNPERLRLFLQRHELISFRNRKSVYTLKEWTHIRTGTIRDTIVEFLLENNEPQTVDVITRYVLQYFPNTNLASIKASMLNDTKRRFLLFEDNLFGLNGKKYTSEYKVVDIKSLSRKTFEQRLYDMEKFLVENDHFPFSNSDNEDEASLYRWWNTSNRKLLKLTKSQQSAVERVKLQYANYETNKSVYEWFINCNKLKNFVIENQKGPSSNKNDTEKYLYGWFRRAIKDFKDDQLNDKQRKEFIELSKLIFDVKR